MPSTRHIGRFTLQAESPLMIGSGEADTLHDNLLIRDANGLPVIPATSLAGALRARAGTKANEIFGSQEGDIGQRSAVTLTDGLFHWSDDRPRDGLVFDIGVMETDALCRCVLGPEPLKREHVRLNGRGTVDGDGKFSRIAVPAGARFTFEAVATRKDHLDSLADILRAALFLGGASRSGYGRVVLVAEGFLDLDLACSEGWELWRSYATRDLGIAHPIAMVRPTRANGEGVRRWGIDGQTEGPLLLGGEPRDGEEDRAPWREAAIVWKDGVGSMGKPRWLIPAGAIKGPLRHRTLFHLHKALTAQGVPDAGKMAETELDAIFGSAATGSSGNAGRLRFSDCEIDCPFDAFRQTHVGLDRFTGGARYKILFTDALLWRPTLSIRFEEIVTLTGIQHEALRAALGDMAEGQLGIGAEWGEGAGILTAARMLVPDPPGEKAADAA
jgi:hypothetical protein